jgi:hypothetical protein
MFLGCLLTRENVTFAHVMSFVSVNVGMYSLFIAIALNAPLAYVVSATSMTISALSILSTVA